MNQPFKNVVTKRLRALAFIFIIIQCLKIVNHVVFGYLLHSLTSIHFSLIDYYAGNGIFTGLIILIIAAIYDHAINIQNENALTV